MSIKINRISTTKRGRFALFADDEFLFSIDDETLVKYHIQEGSLLTNEELSSLKDASDLRKAKNQALRYLSLRAYAQKELYDKLCLKYDEHTAAVVIKEMENLALLDDETFAIEKAKGMLERGKSSNEVKRKLNSLGISDKIIQIALEYAQPDDYETAMKLLTKGGYITKLRNGEKEKVMAALARRGFAHTVIRTVIQQALQEIALETQIEYE